MTSSVGNRVIPNVESDTTDFKIKVKYNFQNRKNTSKEKGLKTLTIMGQ